MKMKKSTIRNIITCNSRKGFSLTELLVAVLILSMVSAVVAGGVPVARDAYEKITVSANAQVMLSTTISALRNELCTASDVSVVGTNTVHYFSPSINNYSEISIGNDKGEEGEDTILIKQFADIEEADIEEADIEEAEARALVRALVSKAVGDKKLYVTYDEVVYDRAKKPKLITFKGLKVKGLDGGNLKTYAELSDNDDCVKIRLICGN